jgi:hypothetical protein
MNTKEYFLSSLKTFHKSLLDSLQGLTDEQLNFRPLGKGNQIAFIIWHVVRTEDSVMNYFWQKKTPVWNAEGWDKKFGMDPKMQGTGMTAEQAASIRILDMGEFFKYMESVFKASEAFLEGTSEKDWEEVRDLPYLGKRNLYQLTGGTALNHGACHLGEIWYVKGLQGLKGSPI